MAKNETALDRLERTKLPSTEREFTLEEQMDSVSTDDFLDGMSDVAKDNLGHLFEEVTTEETPAEQPIVAAEPVMVNEPVVDPVVVAPEPVMVNMPAEQPADQDELFNNNTEPKRKYRRNSKDSAEVSQSTSNPMNGSSNPLLDQLAKDVIDDLRSRHYKINRFDDKSMEMIFNYMYNKF